MLGVIYGVLLWTDMNAATPPGVRGRSGMSLAHGMSRVFFDGSRDTTSIYLNHAKHRAHDSSMPRSNIWSFTVG